MKARVLVVTLVVVVLPLYADQVQLKNGDRVTGKIVKKDGATLTVRSDMMGDVTLKWENVTSLVTDQELTVVPPEGEPLKGKLVTSGDRLEVAGKQVPLAQVGAIRDAGEQAKYERFLHPPLTALWVGFVDLGLAAAQGNAKTTTFNTAFNATRATNHDSVNLHFNQILSRGLLDGKTVDTARAVRGGWSYNRNISEHAFVNIFNDYEYDAFQNLDLRLVAGGGLGWKIWKKERGVLDVVGGGSFDRDAFSVAIVETPTPQFTRRAGEAYWGDNLSYKLGGRSSVKQSFRMFNNLTSTGQYRVNFDLGMESRLNRWLSWQITASDRYLTNPAPGRKTNDVLISSGIRLSFAP